MTLSPPSLPSNLVFVVQFRLQPTGALSRYDGRVEHLVSAQVARFHSLEELLAFMIRMLSRRGANKRRPREPAGGRHGVGSKGSGGSGSDGPLSRPALRQKGASTTMLRTGHTDSHCFSRAPPTRRISGAGEPARSFPRGCGM